VCADSAASIYWLSGATAPPEAGQE